VHFQSVQCVCWARSKLYPLCHRYTVTFPPRYLPLKAEKRTKTTSFILRLYLSRGKGMVLNLIHQWMRFRPRSSRQRMRSSRMVRAPDCQCQSGNTPGFNPSILRLSRIWGASDEAVLNIVHKKDKMTVKKVLKMNLDMKQTRRGWLAQGWPGFWPPKQPKSPKWPPLLPL
jgi:hypothetical protein